MTSNIKKYGIKPKFNAVFLAESQGFEDRFFDFSTLFLVLQIHYSHFLFFLKLCIAYCFGYFHCNCSMIAVKEKY